VEWLRHIDVEKFLLFTLILTRISGLMLVAPIYGTKSAPMQVRAFFSIALALLIAPSQWHVAVAYPQTTLLYAVFVGSELVVGLSLGLAVVVLFSGIELAGQVIGHVSGLSLAEAYDPSIDDNVSIFSQLMSLVTTAVFVCIGGHRIVMAALLDTFQAIPPGSGAFPHSVADALVVLVSQSFALAARACVPVVTAVLLATLVLGLIGRTVPQLNVLMLGFGLNSMLTLAAMSLTLGAAVWVFQDQLQPAVETMLEALQVPFRSEWLM
jgi:flagellar biosynthetic protein FliR